MFDPKELLNVLTGGDPGLRAEGAAAATNDALERGKQVATAAALTLDPSLTAHFNQTALLHTASAH